MIEMFSLMGVFACVGMFIYYRYTDSRNVTVQTLKDYIKQSETHIETILRKKEKEFEDKMIASEIVIERMHRLTNVLQEKLDLFDKDILQGQELFDALRNELSSVHDDLYEYKQIRVEFKDIEDRIEAILNIKKQVEDGTAELQHLKETIAVFSEEFSKSTENIKFNSRNELDLFFHTMQQDLSEYLSKSRQQLHDKDREMSEQIQELSVASGSIADSINEFKEYAHTSIDQLKNDCERDFEIARSITESNITDIYDMWDKVKEQTQQETDGILTSIQNQQDFFEDAEDRIRKELTDFNSNMSTLSNELQTNFSFNVQEKLQDLDKKVTGMYFEIEKKGAEVQNQLESSLSSQTSIVREELDRIYSAFVEQEQLLEDKIKSLGIKVQDDLSLAEKNYHENLSSLNSTIQETQEYAENILQNAKHQVDEKIVLIEQNFKEEAQENIHRIEESFKKANQERITQSINDISHSLEMEFKQQYQENIENIFVKAEELEESVKSKFLYVEELDTRLQQINDHFNVEKEKIILMCQELEQDRESSKDLLIEQVNQCLQDIQAELTESVKSFIDTGSQQFVNDQELWKSRFDEIVQEGRDELHKIKTDIDGVHRLISNIEDSSLLSLKREVERLTQDAQYKMDDIKKYVGDVLRTSKEDFNEQADQARQGLKDLKQELWDQEKEMQQIIQKDIDRVSVKIKEIDKQYVNFMKKSERLDKAEELVRKIGQQQSEIFDLKKDVENLQLSLKTSNDQGSDIIQKMQHIKEELDNKTEELYTRSSEADRIQEFLLSAIKEAENVTHIFSSLAEEKNKAEELEELLLKNLETFNTLQDSLNELENKRVVVEEMMSVIDQSTENMSHITSVSEEMTMKMQEMNNFVQEVQDKLGSLQKEIRELTGDQTKVRTAVSKLHDLEHIVIHIDEEMKRLEKMRDWIAKSMNNVDRISAKSGIGSFEDNDSGLEDANVKNVLRLYETGWSINDIAKNLKVSPAYVELIIERYRS